MNPLKIVAIDEKNTSYPSKAFPPKTNRQETQGRFEILWHRQPEKFDPLKSCMEVKRLSRTLELIEKTCSIKGKKLVDLGCGCGVLSRKLRDKGAFITAVDVAKNALENFRKNDADKIILTHDCFPQTRFDDGSFDIVLCTDLIAYLRPKEYRISVSELARLVKKEGVIVCSTPIDIYSEGVLEQFFALLETELTILEWKLSYHSYYIRIRNIFKSTLKFARGGVESDYREKEIQKRKGFAKFWYTINSGAVMGNFWKFLKPLMQVLYNGVNKNATLMICLEKMCRFLSQESGVSHVIIVAERRSLKKAGDDSKLRG